MSAENSDFKGFGLEITPARDSDFTGFQLLLEPVRESAFQGFCVEITDLEPVQGIKIHKHNDLG